ncbi:hypothetical protein D9758_018095 [Tetrapyrgos nigripes]|uniref:Uncharacterized protein n=1 Tax=Tetrapyrgos nigripes TaxID=182062 RepID=A0A8H5FCU6_9AGAR|nr:hypothetical protein D9758_018095 [Tetrapyrgos nigripes]
MSTSIQIKPTLTSYDPALYSPIFGPVDETEPVVRVTAVEPPPLPETLKGLKCVYGYELTDELLANCDLFVSRKNEALTSGHLRAVRGEVVYEVAEQVGLFSPIMEFLSGAVRDATDENAVYFADTLHKIPRPCVAEDVLRQLEQKLGTDIKAKWIAV